MSTMTSTLLLVLVACLAFLGVWSIMKRLRTLRACYLLATLLMALSLACTWFLDLEFPLQDSTLRATGQSSPWFGAVMFFIQSAGVAGVATAASRHRRNAGAMAHTHD